jgi:osmotically-inducible protein OsmY
MSKRLFPGLALIALTASLLLGQQPVGQRGGRLDAKLQQQVQAEMQKEKKLKGVTVTVDDAVVTLAGEVDHWFCREDAEAHARKIKGVRRVVDNIDVRNMPPPDPQLAGQVMAALNDNDLQNLHVVANHGEVTVSGWVRTQQDRDYAEQLIYGIKGVERVENHIGVSNPH